LPQLSTFVRSPEVIGAELDSSLVLLHTGTWTYLELNDTGIEVWKQLEQRHSLAALVTELVKEFDVDELRCRRETQDFIDNLLARHFIQCLPDGMARAELTSNR
jgi:hypothetical protein